MLLDSEPNRDKECQDSDDIEELEIQVGFRRLRRGQEGLDDFGARFRMRRVRDFQFLPQPNSRTLLGRRAFAVAIAIASTTLAVLCGLGWLYAKSLTEFFGNHFVEMLRDFLSYLIKRA